jgi:hypothetical protein
MKPGVEQSFARYGVGERASVSPDPVQRKRR